MKTINSALALTLFGVLVETQKSESPQSESGTWESIKDFFRGLNIEVHEKFSQFGAWIRETYDYGADKGKNQMDHIRSMAETFVSHTKEMSHEVAEEGEEFFRPYKDDLGHLWDKITNKVHETVEKGQKGHA